MTTSSQALETVAQSPTDEPASPGSPGRRRALQALRRDRGAWVGGGLAAAILVVAAVGPLFAPHDPEHAYRELMPLNGDTLPPSAMFPLGTDQDGRDYLSRLLYATRTTLVIGLAANLVAVAIGVLVGLIAAYASSVAVPLPWGRSLRFPLGTLLMRVTDVGLAFPALLLAIVLTTIFKPSVLAVAVVIAAVLWTTTARLVHARSMTLKHSDFILAARAVGCTPAHIMARHLLPHLLPLIVVCVTLGITTSILFEATLSFVGAGVPADTPTWGKLLASNHEHYRQDPRLPFLPGLAIFLTVMAFSLLGDALRDALDPHTRDAA